MKNFCPKCGNPLKPNAKFCPKCGTKIEHKVSPRQNMTEQVVQTTPQKPKKFKNYKAFIIAMAVIIVAIAGGFGFVIYQKNNQASKATSALTHKSNKSHAKKASQNDSQSENQSTNASDSSYSNDEWMLMGYMAYAHDNYVESRHISGTSDLVEDVGEDIADNDLKVDKNSDSSYTLSNKFGSVDIDVDSDDVKVKADNGDEVTTDKDKLEDTFSSYKGQIQKMTSYIKNGGSDAKSDEDSEASEKSSKSSITGDTGVFTVPSEMQGTWYYSTGDSTKFIAHGRDDGKYGKYEFHTQEKNLESKIKPESKEWKTLQKQTDHIYAVFSVNSAGLKGFGVKPWLHEAGFFSYYAPYTLKGQPVILEGQIQNWPEIREVLWKSPELAKKYKDAKFPEIDKLNQELSKKTIIK